MVIDVEGDIHVQINLIYLPDWGLQNGYWHMLLEDLICLAMWLAGYGVESFKSVAKVHVFLLFVSRTQAIFQSSSKLGLCGHWY